MVLTWSTLSSLEPDMTKPIQWVNCRLNKTRLRSVIGLVMVIMLLVSLSQTPEDFCNYNPFCNAEIKLQ